LLLLLMVVVVVRLAAVLALPLAVGLLQPEGVGFELLLLLARAVGVLLGWGLAAPAPP
jgi:hypothetical protein